MLQEKPESSSSAPAQNEANRNQERESVQSEAAKKRESLKFDMSAVKTLPHVLAKGASVKLRLLPEYEKKKPEFDIQETMPINRVFFVLERNEQGELLISPVPDRDIAWGWVRAEDIISFPTRAVTVDEVENINGFIVPGTDAHADQIYFDGKLASLADAVEGRERRYLYTSSELTQMLSYTMRLWIIVSEGRSSATPQQRWAFFEEFLELDTDLIDFQAMRKIRDENQPAADDGEFLTKQKHSKVIQECEPHMREVLDRLRIAWGEERDDGTILLQSPLNQPPTK